MKLEEATKILQKTVKSNNEVIKETRKNGDINVMQLTADLNNQSIAIETILQENEKLKNKNDRFIQKNIEYEKTLEKLQKDTIWKYKIEDRIKELDNKPIKIYSSNKKYYYETDQYNKIIKQVLQELLENK